MATFGWRAEKKEHSLFLFYLEFLRSKGMFLLQVHKVMRKTPKDLNAIREA